MVVFVICPFCHQETREHVVKTESVFRDAERIDSGDNLLVYPRCENCEKVWIEFKNVSAQS